MLKLEITGDTHPKTVKLVTDDANAELGIIDNMLEEAEVPKGDSYRAWFDDASPEELKEGVEIPADHIGEWGELLESGADEGGPDFETASLAIDQLREQAMDELQDA